jgi:3-oxoacyl-[acyl-carrier-protein] synthase-3
VPEHILSNEDLAKLVDTSDEWITSRTGIKERRIMKDGASSDMAAAAVKALLEKKGIDPLEIELVIVGTVTPDHPFPSTANIVCDKVGMKNAWSYDVNAACSGFLYALSTGSQFIESGKHKKVIVIGVDKMTSIIDYQDRTTCVIFGDGAGAVLLEPNEEGNGVMDFILRSDGAGRQYLQQPAGGSAMPASVETVENRMHYVKQEGQAVFKFAVTNMADVSAEIMERNNLTSDDVSWLVPHQANLRIIDATANRMGLTKEKVMINIQRYGNTTAGTLPLCLWDYESQLKKGDVLILSAFGGGFTWGAIYLKWAYNS